MSQLEAKKSAIPADSASVAVVSLQSNTKPYTQNQDLHDNAVKLLVEIDASKKKSSDYNVRRREATEKLRPVLKKIWEAFDKGETVGGCTGKKEWCKQVQSITYRRCLQIINGENQTKKVKSLHLKAGKLFHIDGDDTVYEIQGVVTRSAKTIGDSYTISFAAKPVGTEGLPQPSDLIVHVNEGKHYDVYIGRKFYDRANQKPYPASIWGNHDHLPLDKYEEHVRSSAELMAQLHTLKGKVLGCFHTAADRRKGLVCHGDVLLKLIGETDGKPLPPIKPRSYENGAVTVQAGWYTPEETNALFEDCARLDCVRSKVRGKEVRHAVRIFCDSESAVRRKDALSPVSEAPDTIKKLLADLSKHSGKNVNYAAVVEYRDGDDFIAPHQHDEDRGNDATVWIVSTGAERPFVVKPLEGDAATKFLATPGSLITLSSEANETHLHSVPKCKGCTAARYSVNCKAIPAEKNDQITVYPKGDAATQSSPAVASADSVGTAPVPTHPEEPMVVADRARAMRERPVYLEGVDYVPEFLSPAKADELLELMKSQPFADCRVSYGPQVFPPPRKSNAWKDRYALATNPQPEPEEIRSLRLRLSERYGVPFNSVQCNWHAGTSEVKAHYDPYRVVAMVRLGATRTFEVGDQRRKGGRNFKAYPMPHGSLITFLSGGLAHRMFPDPAAGECVSLVFRLVTPPQTVASWQDKAAYGKTRAAHKKLYDAAVSDYRSATAEDKVLLGAEAKPIKEAQTEMERYAKSVARDGKVCRCTPMSAEEALKRSAAKEQKSLGNAANEPVTPSPGPFKNAGIGSPTECLTFSVSECPSNAVASSLSDILETGDVAQRYYLTAKCCAGILRRATTGKRTGKLSPELEKALMKKSRSVTVETYRYLYDPNYGKQFTICGHGVVHLEGEACDCGRGPASPVPIAAAPEESRPEKSRAR